MLLGLLVKTFVPEGDPLVVGINETLERHRGKKIAAGGLYRGPARSTHERLTETQSAMRLEWLKPSGELGKRKG